MSPQRVRTPLQAEVDKIDCNLYNLLTRIERLAEEHKNHSYNSHWLQGSMNSLRATRARIRQLMHNDDREATTQGYILPPDGTRDGDGVWKDGHWHPDPPYMSAEQLEAMTGRKVPR